MGIRQISSGVPEQFSLSQNYPNPFNPSTKIRFEISEPSQTKLFIYDALGSVVANLVNENFCREFMKRNSMLQIFQAELIFTNLNQTDSQKLRKCS
ncbi:MAG: hypothetical protein IPG99_17030 [Ignavibacteria bacterium]|nr:hypothetical protein [Ignavibacteria bacterium]